MSRRAEPNDSVLVQEPHKTNIKQPNKQHDSTLSAPTQSQPPLTCKASSPSKKKGFPSSPPQPLDCLRQLLSMLLPTGIERVHLRGPSCHRGRHRCSQAKNSLDTKRTGLEDLTSRCSVPWRLSGCHVCFVGYLYVYIYISVCVCVFNYVSPAQGKDRNLPRQNSIHGSFCHASSVTFLGNSLRLEGPNWSPSSSPQLEIHGSFVREHLLKQTVVF